MFYWKGWGETEAGNIQRYSIYAALAETVGQESGASLGKYI